MGNDPKTGGNNYAQWFYSVITSIVPWNLPLSPGRIKAILARSNDSFLQRADGQVDPVHSVLVKQKLNKEKADSL